MKGQLATIYACVPHQTGVTQRSVGGDDWNAADLVLNYVMIGYLPYGISYCLAVYFNRYYLVVTCNEARFACFYKSSFRQSIEHPFEMILPREPTRSEHDKNEGDEHRFTPPPSSAAP